MSRKYSHSALKTAQRCLKSWYYRYIMRLEQEDKPKYFEAGSELHALLEALYASDKEGDETIFEEAFVAASPEHQEIIERYIMEYPDGNEWEIVSIEEDYEMQVAEYIVVFKPDLVVRLNGDLWVVDHKTVAEIPEETDPYNMTDFQHLLYLEGIHQVLGEMPRGFIFNYVRRKSPRQPALVKDGSRIADLRRMDTDYATLRRFAEKHGMMKDPDVLDKLKILRLTPNRYFQRHYITANPDAIDAAVNDTLMALRELEAAEIWDQYPRHVLGSYAGSAACSRCAFQPICFSEMMGINSDPELLGYIERPQREK